MANTANILTLPRFFSFKKSLTFNKRKNQSVLRIFKPAVFVLVVSLFNIIAVFLLVFQSNFSVKETYQIQNYQKEITRISQENNYLEIELSRLNSLESANLLAGQLDMEKSDKIFYLKAIDNQMARR
jgi:hypothetical protein